MVPMKEMVRNIDEKEFQKLTNLLGVLSNINLDLNWLLAVASLSAQEIAIKRKMNELGITYGEEDLQKLADNLINEMNKRKLEVPHILLSIARSYRHIRAKVMHDPHKARLNVEESDAIFHNTEALVRTLFRKDIEQIDVIKFINSIDKFSMEHRVKEFTGFNEQVKKQIFETIMNKISLLDWREIQAYEGVFEFLKASLKSESNPVLQNELFDILLTRTLIDVPSFVKEKLLAIIAEFTRLSSIKKFIREKGHINSIIAEYEMSNSFSIAGFNAEIILNLSSLLDNEQLNRIVDAALSNDQIAFSWGARSSLKKFLLIHQDKIPKDKTDKLLEVLKS
jgi:indole-3-glycerol phosphate synthase